MRVQWRALVAGGGLLGLCAPAPASAEVFCHAASYVVSAYIYGVPALENITLVDGGSMAHVSLCGTNCADGATEHRLSLAITAQARGVPLRLYFANQNSCAEVPAYEKPFMVSLLN